MGSVYTAGCRECGYKRQLFLGSGRMDCVPLSFISTLPKKQQKALDKAMKKGAAQIVLERFASVCKKCGELFAQPVVTYYLNDSEYKIFGFCPKCSSDKCDIVSDKVLCPDCRTEISLKETGLWD